MPGSARRQRHRLINCGTPGCPDPSVVPRKSRFLAVSASPGKSSVPHLIRREELFLTSGRPGAFVSTSWRLINRPSKIAAKGATEVSGCTAPDLHGSAAPFGGWGRGRNLGSASRDPTAPQSRRRGLYSAAPQGGWASSHTQVTAFNCVTAPLGKEGGRPRKGRREEV